METTVPRAEPRLACRKMLLTQIRNCFKWSIPATPSLNTFSWEPGSLAHPAGLTDKILRAQEEDRDLHKSLTCQGNVPLGVFSSVNFHNNPVRKTLISLEMRIRMELSATAPVQRGSIMLPDVMIMDWPSETVSEPPIKCPLL